MQQLIRSLAQILCDDLARAEKAKDGKKKGSSFMEPVGGTEDLETKALLPADVAMWGKTKFAFGKYEKEKTNYKTVFEKDPSYVSWCRKHLTKDSAKGPALDWSRYIKARDLVDCKAANVPFYAGTALRREFCD